jgi:hypothetical protein
MHQDNKQHTHQYGKLPAKLVITIPWEALCIDIIGPCTLKGKDVTQIDFMCLTIIDSGSSSFEVVELPVTTDAVIPMKTKGRNGTKTHNKTKLPYVGKSSVVT